MFSRTMTSAAILLLASTGVALPAQPDIKSALVIEWMVANCDHSTIPAVHAALASMVISGSEPTRVEAARAEIRTAISQRHQTVAAACTELTDWLKKAQP